LIAGATVLGIAGTDLVLPAIPGLPAALGGNVALAQFVLAAFVAGAAGGLLFFGALGARFDQRRLLAGAVAAYALLSWLAGRAQSLEILVGLRFLHGAAGAAAATFAPAMLRALYPEARAVRAIGLLSSIESLVPAFAPVLGALVIGMWGWRGTFDLLALLSLVLAAALLVIGKRLPPVPPSKRPGGYLPLLKDAVYLRYALSHACTLGGLLTFVFGAPSVFANALGGSIRDFVAMQVTGILFFIVSAMGAGRLTDRFGPERMIAFGTALSAASGLAILGYSIGGGHRILVVTALFVPMNLGLGLRGPPGFLRAIIAARGDDSRGAALLILAILAVATLGTSVAAPFIAQGLVPLAGVSALILVAGWTFLALPKLAPLETGTA
jgi:MFS family permease